MSSLERPPNTAGNGKNWIRELAGSHPLVSVVIPARQEESHIRQCLAAVLAQKVDSLYEVLVVDGMSTDRTRDAVKEIAESHERIRLLDNPKHLVASAMNIGIRAAKGAFVVRVDGHCRVPPDYLQEVLRAFQESGAECVGGSMVAEGESFWGRIIARATSTTFGMGGKRFHGSGEPRFMDTVYLGAYPATVLTELGMYDERFVRNQDDELNYRLRANGGRVYFTPRIWAAYTTRSTLRRLMSQYAQYGWWKVDVYRKHPGLLQIRHLVPTAFLVVLIVSVGLAALAGGAMWGLPALVIGLHLLGATLSCLLEEVPPTQIFPMLLVFLIIHLSYGAGFLARLSSPSRFGSPRPD